MLCVVLCFAPQCHFSFGFFFSFVCAPDALLVLLNARIARFESLMQTQNNWNYLTWAQASWIGLFCRAQKNGWRLQKVEIENGKWDRRVRVEICQPNDLPVKLIVEILKSFIIGDCVCVFTIAQRNRNKNKILLDAMRRGVLTFSFLFFSQKFIFREILLCVVRARGIFILLRPSSLEYVPNIMRTYYVSCKCMALSKCVVTLFSGFNGNWNLTYARYDSTNGGGA